MKKKIWGVLLSVAVLVTTVNFPTTAGAEENKGGADASGIVVKVSDDMNGSNANESDEIQTVQISAQNQSNMDAVVRIFLLNEDKETADTEVEIPNLCDKDQITDETVQTEMAETLKSALTLESGTNSALDAQWIEKKDDSGNVTAKYLEAALPAGTAAAFDMQLMYRMDEENYTKKTIVRAKAFVDEQDVTKASDVEDEDNEAEVKWEVVKVEEESEAAEERAETASASNNQTDASGNSILESSNAVQLSANNGGSTKNTGGLTVYFDCSFAPNDEWFSNDNLYVHGFYSSDNSEASGLQKMKRSDRGENIFEYTFDQNYTNVIFTKGGDWNTSVSTPQGEGMTIPTNMASPCFKLTGINRKNCPGEWYDLGTASYAGTTLDFYDMTSDINLEDVSAVFITENGESSEKVSVSGGFQIPEDVNDNPYIKVSLTIDGVETEIYDLSDIVKGNKTTFYYGVTSLGSGEIISSWGTPVSGNESLADKTLYFGSDNFNINSTIKIDGGEDETLDHPSDTNNVLSYTFDNDSSATQQSIISVTSNGVTYRFFWKDDSYNKVTVVDNVADVNDMYSTAKRIYFDSSLSKLSYAGTENVKNGGQGIPYNDNSNVYVYATGTNVAPISAQLMTRVGETDIYCYELPAGYTQIRFAGYAVSDANESQNGDATDMLTIPMGYTQPCFFADSSDDVIYNGGNRGGYWDEYGSVRDAESGKNTDVVDIPTGTFTRESDILYVDTTLYDYYTDYELNGNNRDNYSDTTITSHRIYQPFRQFNQALSSYYEENNASSPLYWGNFQNYTGSPFKDIAGTLDLFGFEFGNISQIGNNDSGHFSSDSDTYKKFFYENNSMWSRDGNVLDNGNNATQDLVASTLSESGNLQIKTESETVDAPYFNTDFLEKSNSKNTALGKVYEDVTFPFVKVDLRSQSDTSATGTVGYWCFDSKSQDNKNKNLQLQYSEQDGYFLQPTNEIVEGQTTSGTTGVGNYFPFNTRSQSGNAAKLNYGFGQKIEFDFRLTEDGTIKTSNQEDVPIEFNFSGDDDVWVFIDGHLVLDVGGGHDVVSGTINFKDKQVKVSGIKNSTGGGADISQSWVDFPVELKNNTNFNNEEHTLTMFYMERGLWESNMMITFNFPDENEFAVEKQVDDTDVNQELFGGLFDDASVFPFTIQNQATHYAEKSVETKGAEPLTYNTTFADDEVAPSHSNNTFSYKDTYGGRSDVVYWYTKPDNIGGSDKNLRFGIISPDSNSEKRNSDGTFDASTAHAYLQFKAYYDWSDTPGLAYMYIQLEDGDGDTIGGYLSGKTYGNSSLAGNTWNTIQVDLSRLSADTSGGKGDGTFDYSRVRYIKFNYDYGRHFYLDDFIFIPSVVAQGKTGFITAQSDIPDYGSVESRHLENADGAQYTLEDANGNSTEYRLTSTGMFALADGETATFKDQFRRGSYIAVTEDVDPNVFDTTWTLYENGSPVTSIVRDNSVNIAQWVSVAGVSGTTLKDGRQEVYVPGSDSNGTLMANSGYTETGWAEGSDEIPTENTIVFRSYSDPDNETSLTKLKAVFTNTVRTGSIVIRKEAAENSSKLTSQYTFRVVFNNVAGMSLEDSAISREYTIDLSDKSTDNDVITIEGIPAGTDYRIKEISASDGATLETVTIESNGVTNAQYDPVTKVVSGKVIASDTLSADITFKNTLKPTVNINLEKKWENTEGVESQIPESIKIKLQRSSDNGASWEDVYYTGDETTAVITLDPGYTNDWTFSFENLDQYVNYQDNPQVPWLYRVVELDDEDEIIDSEGYLGDYFKVTYSDNLQFESVNPSDGSFTITNTYSPKTTLEITKVDASETGKKLGGVEFTLEKGTVNSDGAFTPDDDFEKLTLKTGTSGDDLGIVRAEDLTDGTYRITETKTQAGYSLLKSPLILVIDRTGDCTIRSEDESAADAITLTPENNVISITVSNRLLFELPSTGGYLRAYMIAGGLALAGIALFIYRLQKRRKEVKTPGQRKKHSNRRY